MNMGSISNQRLKVALLVGVAFLLTFSLISLPTVNAKVESINTNGSNESSIYPLQGSLLNWTFVKGSSPSASYFAITVGATGANPFTIPKNVQVSAWITYEPNPSTVSRWIRVIYYSQSTMMRSSNFSQSMTMSSTYFNQACAMHFAAGNTSSTCALTAPFNGGGEYVFYATFKSNGIVLAQQIVDPTIEPEW